MRAFVLIAILLSAVPVTRAQQDDEYLMEIGGGVGMISYEGDFNGNILKGMQPMASLIVRRNLNPYMGFRFSGTYGKLKGKAADTGSYYPDDPTAAYSFSHPVVDVGAVYEYNFWPYGTGRDYRGARRLTPYIYGGIGATYVSGTDKSVFTANVPIGLGVKYKLKERWNVGVEWGIHFSLSDKLDGVEDPYGIKSSGLFKNTDCYSGLQLTLPYSFMTKCRTCNNDD